MTKKILYLAIALFSTTAFISCLSDDENDQTSVDIPRALYADYSGKYKLNSPVTGESGKILMSIDILDGGQAAFEIYDPVEDKTDVVITDVSFNGDEINIKSNERINGSLAFHKPTPVKASEEITITLNITIDGILYVTEEGSPVACVAKAMLDTNGGVLDYISQKFKVTGMVVDLKGDVNAYKEFVSSAKLMDVALFANENGADLTEEEIESFNKTVSYISVSRYGSLNIAYTDGTCDGGDWNWLNKTASQIKLWFKDKGMGCTYIPENTTVDLEFSGNMCAMSIHADIKGNKNYTARLSFIMEVVQ